MIVTIDLSNPKDIEKIYRAFESKFNEIITERLKDYVKRTTGIVTTSDNESGLVTVKLSKYPDGVSNTIEIPNKSGEFLYVGDVVRVDSDGGDLSRSFVSSRMVT